MKILLKEGAIMKGVYFRKLCIFTALYQKGKKYGKVPERTVHIKAQSGSKLVNNSNEEDAGC